MNVVGTLNRVTCVVRFRSGFLLSSESVHDPRLHSLDQRSVCVCVTASWCLCCNDLCLCLRVTSRAASSLEAFLLVSCTDVPVHACTTLMQYKYTGGLLGFKGRKGNNIDCQTVILTGKNSFIVSLDTLLLC